MILCIRNIFIFNFPVMLFKTSANSSSSPPTHDYSIVTLSSDSEDDLPSLSQRIGLTRTVCSSTKDPVEQGVHRSEGKLGDDKGLSAMECIVIRSEVPSASPTTGQADFNKHPRPNDTATTSITMTAHDDTISMPTAPTNSQAMETNNKYEVVTIGDDNSPSTMDQLPPASTLTNRSVDFISCHSNSSVTPPLVFAPYHIALIGSELVNMQLLLSCMYTTTAAVCC